MNPVYGPYPGERDSNHDVGEPDTSRLGRGEASEGHQSLIDRRARRLRGDPAPATEPTDPNDKTGVPTATKPNLASVSDSSVNETRGFRPPKGLIILTHTSLVFIHTITL